MNRSTYHDNETLESSHLQAMADIARFPSENPAPVLRVAPDGKILYSNFAGKQILEFWQTCVDGYVPKEWHDIVSGIFRCGKNDTAELKIGGVVYSFAIVPVVDAGYINLYGRDITELAIAKVIIEDQAKFPSENPAPVLRVDIFGKVLYSNNAGLQLLDLWGTDIGGKVPDSWKEVIREIFESKKNGSRNVELGDMAYSLAIVPVEKANYVNLYGRDVTEQLRAEAKIKDYNKNLEAEVKLRTRELIEKNALLKNEIEERKQAESQLKDAQSKLIQAEKMVSIGQLAAGIGHEINNPLGAIKSANSIIQNDFGYIINNLKEQFHHLEGHYDIINSFIMRLGSDNSSVLSTKEKREFVRDFETRFEGKIRDTRRVANLVVNTGMHENYDDILPIFMTNDIDVLNFIEKVANIITSNKVICDAVDHSSRIVYALREYAYSNKKQDKTVESVLKILDDTLLLYRNKLKYGIELVTEYDNVPEIACYPGELCQVWANLLHNSIQAMDGNGKITINVTQSGSNIIVCFHDNGPGIPEDIQTSIFEPFFTTKPPGMGTGLGLDIVKRIIDRHAGTIVLESTPGNGTKFTISLPV